MAKVKVNSQEWEEVSTSGEYARWIDWDATTEIIGKVAVIREMEYQGTSKKVMEIETVDGERYSIGETGLLKFPKDLTAGRTVRIINNGWTKLKSGRRARDLKLLIKKEEPF